jgi:hypothetical protein
MPNTTPIYIYFHICTINTWREIVTHMLNKIKESGLYNEVKEIRCVVLGEYNKDDEIWNDPKINVIYTTTDSSQYERPTLNRIYEHSKIEDFNVLYLHSKGVTKPGNLFVQDWNDFMLYFDVTLYNFCIKVLDTHDAVGVNLRHDPKLHFSGNFWWSRSSHIKTLEPCIDMDYFAPEMWIAGNRKGSFVGLWDSHICHYWARYPKELYMLNKIQPVVFKR